MKTAIIDVGSNSVRLCMIEDGKTLYKDINITKLADKLALTGFLSKKAIQNTIFAIEDFKKKADEDGADKIYIFATSAVRSSENGEEFTKGVKDAIGIDVDVLSGKQEARIGAKGSLNGNNGGVIDIGGGSTEITVSLDENIVGESLNIGTVRIIDLCGQDREKSEQFINEKLNEMPDLPATEKFYAIGGTATQIAAIKLSLEVYDRSKVHMLKLSLQDLEEITDLLYKTEVEDRVNIQGVHPMRAEVIGAGSLLLLCIMKKFNIQELIVSESDNLEGYYLLKMENLD